MLNFTQTGMVYSTLICTLCGGNKGDVCTAAVESVSVDCATSLGNGEASVCSGTCAIQLTAVVSACGSSVSLIPMQLAHHISKRA